MTKNQNPEERNLILNSYLESDVLGFGQFDSAYALPQNSVQSNSSSNKDDDHKLRELKQPQQRNLMLLFDEQLKENSLQGKLNGAEKNTSDKSTPDEFSSQNTKESVARFINAMASIKTGRDYISKFFIIFKPFCY